MRCPLAVFALLAWSALAAKALGGQAQPLPAGALNDNLTLIRENETELSRLTRTGEGRGT